MVERENLIINLWHASPRVWTWSSACRPDKKTTETISSHGREVLQACHPQHKSRRSLDILIPYDDQP